MSMQTVEAILSLLVFSSISASFLSVMDDQAPLDDSLYRLQLAEDAWRVLYLRGDLRDLDGPSGAVESDLGLLGEETGLCYFFSGVQATNCRGGEPRLIVASIRRTVISGGKPEAVSFSLGK